MGRHKDLQIDLATAIANTIAKHGVDAAIGACQRAVLCTTDELPEDAPEVCRIRLTAASSLLDHTLRQLAALDRYSAARCGVRGPQPTH